MKRKKLDDFIALAEQAGISVASEQRRKLEQYLQLLLGWGRKVNLYSSGDRAYLVERHFAASLFYVKVLQVKEQVASDVILDFGSGAGFPGIMVAILFKPQKLILVDSSRKKTLFLKKVITQLGLPVTVLCLRIEDYNAENYGSVKTVLVRAVASIDKLITILRPVIKPEGRIYSIKGSDYQTEIKNTLNTGFIYNPICFYEQWKTYSPYFENKIMLEMEQING